MKTPTVLVSYLVAMCVVECFVVDKKNSSIPLTLIDLYLFSTIYKEILYKAGDENSQIVL